MGEVLELNTVDNIINSIYIIRGQQVMLDSDLAKISDQLVFGGEYDFFERPDGYDSLCDKYNFKFKNTMDMDIGLKYQAINEGKVDVMDIFTTDGQLSASDVVVLKDDKEETFKLTPKKEEENGETVYRYGFSIATEVKKGFFNAIKYGFTKLFSLMEQMLMIIGYLCTGKLSLSSLSGPIGIYKIVGASAKNGLINLVYLTGYLCVNVGIINIIPLPAFDGGRILFLIIEKIKGKPVSPKVENTIHSIGMVLLMILMVAITINDIIKLFQ